MRDIRSRVGLLALGASACLGMAQGPPGASQAHGNLPTRTLIALDGQVAGIPVSYLQTQTSSGTTGKLVLRPEAMTRNFYAGWIAPVLQGQRPAKKVQIGTLDATGRMTDWTEVPGAAPQEIVFPPLDAARKEALSCAVTFAGGVGRKLPVPVPPPVAVKTPAQSLLLSSNFRILIPGLDTTTVSRIEAITVAAPGHLPAVASPNRKVPPSAGTVGLSNLVVLVSQNRVQPFQDWLTKNPTLVRSASIAYLKPNLTEWASLSLQGLRIVQITTENSTGPAAARRARVEMAIGGIALQNLALWGNP